MPRNLGLLLAPLLLIAAATPVACGGGGGDDGDGGARDLAEVPTATLPDATPEPIMIGAVTPAPAAGDEQTYVVQAGDSPSSIAAQYGVTSDELMAANGITDPTSLIVGQELIIPDSAQPNGEVAAATEPPPEPTAAPVEPTAAPTEPPAAEQQVYIVQDGDIPETIAAQFGITTDELMAANGIADPTSLFIGQELVIPTPSP